MAAWMPTPSLDRGAGRLYNALLLLWCLLTLLVLRDAEPYAEPRCRTSLFLTAGIYLVVREIQAYLIGISNDWGKHTLQ